MPSRKQRRRRDKTFRHEYDLVTYDDEGNEVSVSAAELKPEKTNGKPKGKSTAGGRRSARGAPPVPSWRRSLRRGGMWGGGMFVVVVFFFRSTPITGRIVIALFYAVAFVPLTYWIDKVAYRSYLKRSGKS